jgi:hypothetical protein
MVSKAQRAEALAAIKRLQTDVERQRKFLDTSTDKMSQQSYRRAILLLEQEIRRLKAYIGGWNNNPRKLKDTGLVYTHGDAVARIRRKSETNEWVVSLRVGGVLQRGATYYTNDLDDAQNTAQDMVKRAVRTNPRRARYIVGQKSRKQVRRATRKDFGKTASDPRRIKRTKVRVLNGTGGITVEQALQVLKRAEHEHYKKNPRKRRFVGSESKILSNKPYLLQEYRKGVTPSLGQWHTICTMTDMTAMQCKRVAEKYAAKHPGKHLRLFR